jgi:elongation factor G
MPQIARVRNVAVVGPHHSGKTTLVEALLAQSRAIGRRGSVADGTTTTDFEPECIDRAQSTSVGFAHASTDNIDITFIDCPGFIDFHEETKLALLAADAAVVVIEADPTRVRQTRTSSSSTNARCRTASSSTNWIGREATSARPSRR